MPGVDDEIADGTLEAGEAPGWRGDELAPGCRATLLPDLIVDHAVIMELSLDSLLKMGKEALE